MSTIDSCSVKPWSIIGFMVLGGSGNFSRRHSLTRGSRILGLNLVFSFYIHLVSELQDAMEFSVSLPLSVIFPANCRLKVTKLKFCTSRLFYSDSSLARKILNKAPACWIFGSGLKSCERISASF